MKILFKICMLLLVVSGRTYGQNWLWSKSQNINSFGALGSNVVLGPSGNLVSYLYDDNGSHLVFTNPDGTVIWNKYFQNLQIKDVILDASDNIYFSGNFSGACSIPPGSFTSQGNKDAIIGELNSSGNLIKSKAFGKTTTESANSVTLKGSDVFVTGSFIETQSVGSVSLPGDNTHENTFVLKMDLNLNATVGTVTQSEGCSGVKVAVDQNNSVYLLGVSNYTLSINTQTTYIAWYGTYLAKLDNNLGLTWLHTLSVHTSNGYYRPFIYFDSGSNLILGHVTGGGGGNDHAVAIEKYDPSGTLLWNTTTQVNRGMYLDIDAQNNIWVAGNYANFDASQALSIAYLNSTGNITGVIYDNNIDHNLAGFALKAFNDFYVIGYCDGTSSLNGYGCSPNGSIFMARYAAEFTGVAAKDALQSAFNVYPNPSTGVITLKCSSGGNKNCLLSVKNMLGQVLATYPIKDMPAQFSKDLDISSQAKGIYFVELRSGEEKKVEKIVLQ